MSDIRELQQRVGRWIVRTFGTAILLDRHERACRIVEEAIELAQAEGLSRSVVTALAMRVYSRPVGHPEQEAAGVAVTLLGWAESAQVDLRTVILRELERIESPEAAGRIRQKQAEKFQAGVGAQPPGVKASAS